MHRAAFRALAACASLTAFATTLSAQPLPLDAQRYAQPPRQYAQPPQYGPQAPQPPAPVNYEPEQEDQGYRNPFVRSPRQAPGVPPQGTTPSARYQINPKFQKQTVPYGGKEAAGTIIIDTPNK